MNTHQLQQRIGYSFTDPRLLENALTHRSYSANNNERLEFLGDSLLSLVISEFLYTHYPNDDEGRLSRMRAHLVKRKTLAQLARSLELSALLHVGAGERKTTEGINESILADALEALLAAIYLDCGSFPTTATCINRIFAKLLNTLDEIAQFKDAKSLLQEWLQARHQQLPVYTLKKESGDPNDPEFIINCQVSLLHQPTVAKAKNKRQAEQLAAAKALEELETLSGQ